MDHKQQHDYTNVELGTNIKVYVRARPPDGRSTMAREFVEVTAKDGLPRKLTLRGGESRRHGEHAFLFDQVFTPEATQQNVFDAVGKPLVDHALKGFNSCCFAYGQTGSGKTYSIFGDNNTVESGGLGLKGTASKGRGIIPRSLEYLFRTLNDQRSDMTSEISVQFLEMYCGQLRDLGAAYLQKRDASSGSKTPKGAASANTSSWFEGRSGAKDMLARGGPRRGSDSASKTGDVLSGPEYERQDLELREDSHGQVNARGAATIPVSSLEEVLKIVRTGFSLRATHETKMNAVSSRSHTIFRVQVVVRPIKPKASLSKPGAAGAGAASGGAADTADDEGEDDDADLAVVRGTLTLVDLAGSERLAKSESSGQRLLEALSINSSLSALGKVAMSLNRGLEYVPYRDSKLTRLLQGSLGGNSYTTLLATLHPIEAHYEECLSTLHFSNSCRDVVNAPHVNYEDERGAKDRRIRRLTSQVAELTKEMSRSKSRFSARLVAIMSQLGIGGEADEDGRFRLADGTVLGGDDAEGDELDGDADELLRSTAGAGLLGGLGGNNSLVGSTVKLRRHLDKAITRNKHLKSKLATARTEAHQTMSRLNETSEGAQRTGASLRVNATRDRQQWAEERMLLTNTIEAMRQEHAAKLTEVAKRTVKMLADQKREEVALRATAEQTMRSVPLRSAMRGGGAAAAQGGGRVGEEQWAMQVQSAEARAEHCKQQYTFWLERSEKNAKANLERFNEFYAESRRRTAAAQSEIAMLYRHANSLAAMWAAVESGAGSWRGSSTPSGIAPLPQGAPSSALAQQLALSTGLARRVTGNSTRPSSTTSFAAGGPVGAVRARRGPSATAPPRQTAARPRSQERPVTPLTPGGMSLDVGGALDKLIADSPLMGEGQWSQRAALEQQVLQELAAHPTVEYIRSLEAEKARGSLRETEHAKEISNLRMALRSKERTISKLRKRPGTGAASSRRL
tara:strand:+ start:2042 stop:4942 length:2901 start_codon:yes stop_codon:yes gene_type:complete